MVIGLLLLHGHPGMPDRALVHIGYMGMRDGGIGRDVLWRKGRLLDRVILCHRIVGALSRHAIGYRWAGCVARNLWWQGQWLLVARVVDM